MKVRHRWEYVDETHARCRRPGCELKRWALYDRWRWIYLYQRARRDVWWRTKCLPCLGEAA